MFLFGSIFVFGGLLHPGTIF